MTEKEGTVPENQEEQQGETCNLKVYTEEERKRYEGVPLGGFAGTNFFRWVLMNVTIQYFLSTIFIWMATGEGLGEEFKAVFNNAWAGSVSLFLLIAIWVWAYLQHYVPSLKFVKTESSEHAGTTMDYAWLPVWILYVLVFAYSAGFIAANALLDVNFLFNLYLFLAFAGLLVYTWISDYKGYFLRIGWMIIAVLIIEYVSWVILHYSGATTATFVENLLSVLMAGVLVILAIVFIGIVLEDGYRYDVHQQFYVSIIFIVETLIIVYYLVAALYVAPRDNFIKRDGTKLPFVPESQIKEGEKKETSA